ncbi:AraC family transcriptional regulator [Proteiniphilum sp.]|uniref:AraC family transcriptional regulator n=1 Tax=Proteiniphilum sp. TaxID=1926877 RepID=UPI002B213F46|nr:AraC family transcriptional regulator [Proteiniphilum sp.]MEA4919114.1 AraC family transcriptional regulator [Proteiniphilum sp.]
MTIPQGTTIFNYSDIIFSYIVNDDSVCTHKASAHALIYVYSGKMSITENGRQITVTAGECVFVKRDHTVVFDKGPYNGERYQGISLTFARNFLRDYFRGLDQKGIPKNLESFSSSVVKLSKSPDIDSLFYSMIPYFDSDNKPNDELMQLKIREGLISLLHIDQHFYPTLFDFTEPWKIDILDFLNKNYMYDLTVEEIASYTGRSLATFKRDFSKISELSPQKWIVRKRLNVAYEKIKIRGEKVADVCFEVGFKNRAHFTTAFKRQYGITPTQ